MLILLFISIKNAQRTYRSIIVFSFLTVLHQRNGITANKCNAMSDKAVI